MPVQGSVIGSFHRAYPVMLEAIAVFNSFGIKINSPVVSEIRDKGAEFVRFVVDPEESSDVELQERALKKILASDFIYVMAPNGYIGRATCYELGSATACGIPVYYSDHPKDLAIHIPPAGIMQPTELAKLLLERVNIGRPR